MFEIKEEIYLSNVPIQYVYEESNSDCPYLLVIFSAFNAPDREIQHSYNYIRYLRSLPCINKLFILDSYGPRGCYYLGGSLKYDVESSVISLITWICQKYKIPWDHVVMGGSSKGGASALYFGTKYNAGHVVIGAPQIFIGDYTKRMAPETLSYLAGSANSTENFEELNRIILKQFDKELFTRINILISERDEQHSSQTKPFQEFLAEKNIEIPITIANEIPNHSAIGPFYQEYLYKYILKLLFDLSIQKIEYFCDDTTLSVLVGMSNSEEIQLKFSVLKGETIIHEEWSNYKLWKYTPSSNGLYTIKVSIYHNNSLIFTTVSKQMQIGEKPFTIRDTNFERKGTTLYFSLDLDIHTEQKLLYAFYILKNGEAVEKQLYQENPYCSFDTKKSGDGKYKIHYFILLEDKTRIIGESSELPVTL